MTIFEHRALALFEEIRDLLLKLSAEIHKTTPEISPKIAPKIALETPEAPEIAPEASEAPEPAPETASLAPAPVVKARPATVGRRG
jgi:hypothetical protein